MRRRTTFLLPLFLLSVLPIASQSRAEEPAHHPINLTLAYPWGTNQDPDINTNFRISLIYGRVGGIRGLDLNGLVSWVGRDVRGIQATGIYSQISGDLKGASLTGLVTMVEGDARWLQASGFVNYNQGHFTGFQFATLFNYTQGGFTGVQWSPVYNMNDGEGRILQMSSLANITGEDFKGVQIATINFTRESTTGVQIGGANLGGDMSGVQFGGVNVARTVKGVQLGLVNIAGTNDGVPIGVVNVADGVDADWITFGSNHAAISTGVRTSLNRWYSMFSVGLGDLQTETGGNDDNTAFITWNWGREFPLGSRWKLGADVGYQHIIPQQTDDVNVDDQIHYSLQARLLIDWKLSRKDKIFAAGGINTIFEEYSSNASSTSEGYFAAGVGLF